MAIPIRVKNSRRNSKTRRRRGTHAHTTNNLPSTPKHTAKVFKLDAKLNPLDLMGAFGAKNLVALRDPMTNINFVVMMDNLPTEKAADRIFDHLRRLIIDQRAFANKVAQTSGR